MSNQIWPPDREMHGCTCTPLADDPNCKMHAVVPYGKKPLTWSMVAETTVGKIALFMIRVTLLIVLAALCARTILWAVGF